MVVHLAVDVFIVIIIIVLAFVSIRHRDSQIR